MPTKHNKKRYQRHEKPQPSIALTGLAYLEYQDEEEIAAASRGDIKLFPSVEALSTTRQGEYGETGFTGYFRADVFDGRTWQPVIVSGLFPGKEHYFGRRERPIDTFEQCAEMIAARGGARLVRTYREHYEVAEGE